MKTLTLLLFACSLHAQMLQGIVSGRIGTGSTVATPTDSPGSGTYGSTQSVTLTCPTSGSTGCYTTDGSTPGAATPGTCDSSPTTTYSGAISVTSTETIKAICTKSGLVNSGVLSSSYTIGSFLYYGPGCVGTSTNTCSIGGTTQSSIQSYTLGASFTLGSNAHGYDVASCFQYMTTRDGTNPQIDCAIYDGTLPNMTSPVCTTTAEITPSAGAGWKENTNFTSCHLAASTLYVIVFQNKGVGNTVVYDAGSETYGYSAGSTYGAWPTSAPWNSAASVRSQVVKVTATP